MKTKLGLFWWLLLACGASTLVVCSREDGRPNPPLQELVPCDPEAGADEPLACPAFATDSAADLGDAGSH